MQQIPSRRLRGVAYQLADLASHLRAAGRDISAGVAAGPAARFDADSAEQFLHDSRSALEAVLLGERDLPVALVGEIMEITAAVDEALQAIHIPAEQ